MNKPKFNIGDEVFLVTSSCNHGTTIPCPVCFGKCKVTVILGNGEHVDTECGHCARGIDPPSGYSTTWAAHANIVSGPITGVSHEHYGWRYEVSGYRANEHDLFTSREEALPVMEAKLKEETERKQVFERDHFITATKKQIWSAGYHRNQIAHHERQINWHKMRLCMIKKPHSGEDSQPK